MKARACARWKGVRATIDGSVRFETSVRIFGKGALEIGSDVQLGCRMASRLPIMLQPRTPEARIVVGPRTVLVDGVEVFALRGVRIGADCLVGARTIILDSDFHDLAPDRRLEVGISKPVVMEDNVWIGTGVMILKGITIGRDAVVGAGAVVTKDVPPGAIAAGNPARIIGSVYER